MHLKAFASVGAILKIINWKKKERRFEVFRKLIIHGLNKQVDCRSLMNVRQASKETVSGAASVRGVTRLFGLTR